VADHLDHARFQALDLFAQHERLALLQADGAVAVAAGQLHRSQQLGVALEEIGRVGQEIGDVVFGDGMFGWVHLGIVLSFAARAKAVQGPRYIRFRRKGSDRVGDFDFRLEHRGGRARSS
jgi:hypothetical protein